VTTIDAKPKIVKPFRGYLILVASSIVLAGILLWSPINAYFVAKTNLTATNTQLAQLQLRQRQLLAQISKLNSPNEIAYLAKVDLNMVYSGAKSLAPLPSGSPNG
ncbi:unnamed protein product, partial [Acidithrix sp. C25]